MSQHVPRRKAICLLAKRVCWSNSPDWRNRVSILWRLGVSVQGLDSNSMECHLKSLETFKTSLRRSTSFRIIPFRSVGSVISCHYVAFDEECSRDIEHAWVWAWSLIQIPEISLRGSEVLTHSHGGMPGISVNEKACPRGEDAASPVQFRHGGHC